MASWLLRKLGAHLLLVIALFVAGAACSRPYRVGDRVLVEWGEEKLLYPAFIIEEKGKSQYRVHYEGYPSRWDETVGLPRVKGVASGDITPPPPPLKVLVARGLKTRKKGEKAPMSQFKEGDRVRVRWRESIYRAQVLEVVSASSLEVHYEGHESAWDEIVPVSRIVDK
jgi:hypothetical protein